MSNGSRIHLPGGAAGAPSPDTPTLLSCVNCGLLCMVPFAIFEAAARSHSQGCIGLEVRAIAKALTDCPDHGNTGTPGVQA